MILRSQTLNLRSHKCYLRLRTIGDKHIFTFRHYPNDGENNLQVFQIKQPASKEVLTDIIKYLINIGILDKNTLLERALPDELHDTLVIFGLFKKLDTVIDRLMFPVYDRDEYFANIKLDRVEFTFRDKMYKHEEIEESTESQTANNIQRVQSLAYGLMSRFELKSLRKPKYVIGLDGIQGVISTSENDGLNIPIHRRTELDLAQSVANVVERPPHQVFSTREDNEKSIQALGKSLELAIERTQDEAQTTSCDGSGFIYNWVSYYFKQRNHGNQRWILCGANYCGNNNWCFRQPIHLLSVSKD